MNLNILHKGKLVLLELTYTCLFSQTGLVERKTLWGKNLCIQSLIKSPSKKILIYLHKSLSVLGSFPLFYQIQKKRSSSSDLNVGADWHPLQFFEAELSFPFKRLQSLNLSCLKPRENLLAVPPP